jgi:hypothetical protein
MESEYAARMIARLFALSAAALLAICASACGDDDSGSEAQRRGVGSACVDSTECTEAGQSCLAFKGGYCGIADCTADIDCPAGSACVTHDDGRNYCFLVCTDKSQCNLYRPLDSESNCSSNITFVDGSKARKSCVPPSG